MGTGEDVDGGAARLSGRRACRTVSVSRSRLYYRSAERDDGELIGAILGLIEEEPGWGQDKVIGRLVADGRGLESQAHPPPKPLYSRLVQEQGGLHSTVIESRFRDTVFLDDEEDRRARRMLTDDQAWLGHV
jgi:hypothetical protein